MTSPEQSGSDQVEVPSWEDFCGRRSLFDRLLDIRRFVLFAEIPPLPEVASADFAQRLSSAIFSHVLNAVENAQFYSEDHLSLVARPGLAGVHYGDDKYDFRVEIDDDTIRIDRAGSRLADFHEWFTALGPPLSALLAGLLDELKKQTGRDFSIFRSAFTFSFILHDLVFESNNRSVRNSEVMRRLVRGMPSDSGAFTNEDEVFDTASRIDVNITRWVENFDGVKRLERYSVEAPANKDGASLWFMFSYGGETYKSPTTRERQKFEHRSFFSEYDIAYAQFLRDKALLSFMSQLMDGVKFKSTSGELP